MLSAKTLKPSQIIFSNGYDKTNNTGKYTISAGTLGGNTATATVKAAYGGMVTVTCNQTLSVARNFPIQWTGSNGILGSGSGSVIVTVKAGETTGTATIKSYNSYTVVFEESGESSLTFAVGASEGFVFTSNILPPKGAEYTLGDEHHPWKDIYAVSGKVNTSDKNKKHDIKNLTAVYSDFFDKLEPVTYKFNDGTSDRNHVGFIAQDVKEALSSAGIDTKDFGGYCEWDTDDGNSSCGLRYEEFIALCVKEIKVLKSKVRDLEKSIC